MTRRNSIVTHIFLFLFFIIIPALVLVRRPGESMFSLTRVLVQDTVGNCILLIFFYLNYYILIPRFFFPRKYLVYILCVVAFLGMAFPLAHLITDGIPFIGDNPPVLPQDYHSPPPAEVYRPETRAPDGQPLFFFSFDDFRRHLYVFFSAIFFSFLLRTTEYLATLKEEKLNAELLSLKAQINPHFLFNTLNSIYTLVVKKDDKASGAIIHLSGLMRYITSDANDYMIPLQKEVDYLTHYTELQKARLGYTATILLDISGNTGNKKIAPLILITYIENAFKYGVNPEVKDCLVHISLKITDTGLVLHTFNRKVSTLTQATSSGIGMKNTRERLAHLYPGKHTLQLVEDKTTYAVTLSIELQ